MKENLYGYILIRKKILMLLLRGKKNLLSGTPVVPPTPETWEESARLVWPPYTRRYYLSIKIKNNM